MLKRFEIAVKWGSGQHGRRRSAAEGVTHTLLVYRFRLRIAVVGWVMKRLAKAGTSIVEIAHDGGNLRRFWVLIFVLGRGLRNL